MIVAASYLDAVTFQICSQSFKIMPTALFAVWLLGQRLAPLQWASLPVLAVGVVRPARLRKGILRVCRVAASLSARIAQGHVLGFLKGFSQRERPRRASQVFVTLNGNAPPIANGAVAVAPGQSDLALGLAASSLSGLSSAYAGARQCSSAAETGF